MYLILTLCLFEFNILFFYTIEIIMFWFFFFASFVGYVLQYRSESGDVTEESHVAPQRNTAVIKSLKCGTKYFFVLTAFNNAGRGEPSEEIMAKTKGSGNNFFRIFLSYSK